MEAEAAAQAVDAMTGTVTWPQLVFLTTVIVASVGITIAVLIWLWTRLDVMEARRIKEQAALTTALMAEIKETRETLFRRIDQQVRDTDEEIGDLRKAYGDTGSALRGKINEVELWMRDHFVPNPHFEQIIKMQDKQNDALGAKFDSGMLRLEAKIDKLQTA